MSLLILGSVAYDTIATPFDRRDRVLGGSGVYSALAASHFTKEVRLLGVVGEDWLESDTAILQSRGVDTTGLERRSGEKTLFWSGRYFDNMNERETLDIQLNVMGSAWEPKVPAAWTKSEYVFLANGGPASHLMLLDKISRPKLVMADTMDFYINNNKDDLLKLLTRIDGLILNDGEAKLLTGASNCISAGKEVLKLGPKFVIVKKGEHGALYISSEEFAIVPAFPTERLVDPTGAGDTFAGALMGYLARCGYDGKKTIRKALAFAAVTAGFCVEGFSCEPLCQITEEQIQERFVALKEMAEI